MGKTVWIIGAGFSKSLGGPSLTELFSPGSTLKVNTCFPECSTLRGDDADLARFIFSEASSRQWRDAEEFLDYLDTARLGQRDSPSREALTTMLQEAREPYFLKRGKVLAMTDTRERCAAMIEPIAEMSRRLLAAECSAFLVGADVKTERWAPYRRWAEKVELGDVVLTFNYDLVMERLMEALKSTRGEKFVFPTAVPEGGLFPDSVAVLKLHGSVNWAISSKNSGEAEITRKDDFFALTCPAKEMVIASPGPAKLAMTIGGPLASLWAAARSALHRAEAIYFIGYRFPPSDSAARRELIDAIGENSQALLNLHTVLGPDTQGEDIRRLSSMLTVAMARQNRWLLDENEPRFDRPYYKMTIWPLWAQDFLDLHRVPPTPGSKGWS